MMTCTRPSRFSACNIKKLGVALGQGYWVCVLYYGHVPDNLSVLPWQYFAGVMDDFVYGEVVNILGRDGDNSVSDHS